MVMFTFIDYHLWQRWAWPIYFLALLVVIATKLFGHSVLGAQRWIGIGPIIFQPSEPAKLLVTLSLAGILSNPKRTLQALGRSHPAPRARGPADVARAQAARISERRSSSWSS